MNTKLTSFPIGNADTTLLSLSTGKYILWDYSHMNGDKHCDLPAELNIRVPDDFDVVCFTHGDEDHVKGMSNYFYLEHAGAYQIGKRKKIKDLWVPAALLLESRNELCSDATILKAEAKYRLLTLKDKIKVFSKPNELKAWVENEGVKFSDIEHLIVDAGTCVPGWSKITDGVEFFVHSPFKGHIDDETVIDRNYAAIVAQATFGNKVETKLMLWGDADSDNLLYIHKISTYKKNTHRLKYDIAHLPHHCSYKALNRDEKGKQKTTPISEAKSIFEDYGEPNCLIISPSDTIVLKDCTQPPHFQAYNYYKEDVIDKKAGMFIVTMEYPSITKPAPLEIKINDTGFKVIKVLSEEEKKAGAKAIIATSIVTGNHGY